MWNPRLQDVNKILVTGLIGSGKSEVCSYLAGQGYPVYDSDRATKLLYETIPGLKAEVERVIGRPFSEIGSIFSDFSARNELEALVYPLVKADFRRFAASCGAETVFFESAVAYGKAQFKGEFDKVVLVRAPYEVRLGRNPKVAQRDAAQQEMPLEEADYIIENNSGLQELHDQVKEMIKTFKI